MNESTLEQLNPEVRILDESHTEDSWQIIEACAAKLSEQGFNHWTDYYTRDTKVVEKMIEKGLLYGYFDDDKLVGIIKISDKAPGYYFKDKIIEEGDERFQNALFVGALGVDPNVQGKGISKKLLKFAEDIAMDSGKNCIVLDTRLEVKWLVDYYMQKQGYNNVIKIDTSYLQEFGESYIYLYKLLS
ncbi:GNAT family N-acetyltransferase [Candidatus Dojkabacteria bacterium]|uniref:GNAT family N-acetyltransferase n=1 Tax=Candidatus Dojkabacteria bacterium TaxID=2099670 RepID=A0A955IEX1_9BACT|nr:GNAT family N-acetyltransferase [Candidatus Dojkabacteria bacterium]